MPKPKIDVKDVVEVAPDVVEIVSVLAHALKKDEDGKIRISREESKALLKAARDLGLAIVVALAAG